MNIIFIFIIFFIFYFNNYVQLQMISNLRQILVNRQPPSVIRTYNNTADLIEYYGYTAEHHNVITEDGYLISVFRIPSDGPPILLYHGFASASDCWVLQGPEQDLAFMLAEQGYDVWLADYRGNTYSRSHLKFTTKNPRFWNFSVHEIGYFDMPAVINYILEVTKRKLLDIIAHSTGVTSFLVLASTRPDFNRKVRSMTALAPGYWHNTTNPTVLQQFLQRYGPVFKQMNNRFSVNEFYQRDNVHLQPLKLACRFESPIYSLCLFYLQNYIGINKPGKNQRIPLSDIPYAIARGVSYKMLLHLTQFGKTGRLLHFDYGPVRNMKLYGSRNPLPYDLSLVTTPIILVYSDGDIHVSAQDVALLSEQLPNLAANYKIDKEPFNHLDFLWALNAKPLVYEFLINILEQIEAQAPSN